MADKENEDLLNLRIKTIEDLLNEAMPDIQNNIINLTLTLSALTNVLIDNKIVETEKLRESVEKISKTVADDYKKWTEEKKKSETKTEEPKKEEPEIKKDENVDKKE